MRFFDVLAIALLVGATVAFVVGNMALARADDLAAFYWLAVGAVTLRGSVEVARPRART
jgi:hypothetical protein